MRKKKEKKEKNVARDKEEELLGGGKNGRISIFQRGEKMGRDKARRFCHKSYKYNLFIRVEDENMSTMETDVPW